MATLQLGTQSRSMFTAMDVYKRKDMPILFRKKNYQRMSWFHELHTLGYSFSESIDTPIHWEDQDFKILMKTGAASSAGAAGAQVVITVNSALITNGTVPFRKNDNVKFKNGVTAQIVAVAADGTTITVRPHAITDPIPALANNEQFGVIGNAKSRGSDQPAGLSPAQDKYYHYWQIIAESAKVEGSILAEDTWIERDSADKPMVKGMYTESTFQAEYRQGAACDDALLFQKLTTNNNVDSNNNNAPISTTEGFFPWMLANGPANQGIAPGALADSHFQAAARHLKTQFVGKHMFMKSGPDRTSEINTILAAKYQNNANIPAVQAEANRELPGYEGLRATQSYQTYIIDNIAFHFNEFHSLNDASTYAYSGSYDTYLTAMFSVGNNKDPKSGDLSPVVGWMWKESHGYSRRMEIWRTGAAGGNGGEFVYTGTVDEQVFSLRSEIGSHYKMANRNIVWYRP